jgi:hypothetical protein
MCMISSYSAVQMTAIQNIYLVFSGKHFKTVGGYFIIVQFSLEQATKAQRGSICTAVLFLELRHSMGWVVKATARPLYPWERAGTHYISL